MEKKSSDFFKNKKVFVAGGSGLIGSAFITQLLSCGAKVRSVHHQRPLPHAEEIEVLNGDLMQPDFTLKACKDMDVVVNATGVTGGSKQVTLNPIPMFTDSLIMATQLLEAARIAEVKYYLMVSNSSVYAASENLLHESDAWGETCRGIPENETGMVKRTAETQCALYAEHTDMQIAIMRTANAYGPYDNFDLNASHVIPALIRKAVEAQTPYRVWGDGSTIRDFIHTSDIARAGLYLLAHDPTATPVNIATGKTVTIAEVVSMIAEITDIDPAAILYTADAPPASKAKRMDTTQMRQLGFLPEIDLRSGLEQTISWYRAHR